MLVAGIRESIDRIQGGGRLAKVFFVTACLAVCAVISGCGSPVNSLSIEASKSYVRADANLSLTAVQNGSPVNGGTWSVLGGTRNGTIDQDGTFHAPSTVPSPNTVSISYALHGKAQTTEIAIYNPAPVVNSATPNILQTSSAEVVLAGSGFVRGSNIWADSVPLATTFLDSSHLSATVQIPDKLGQALQLTVSNPDPGGLTSSAFVIRTESPHLSVSPTVLTGGPVTLTITGMTFTPDSVVLLDGKALSMSVSSGSSVTAVGYLPPWRAGTATVGISQGGSTPIAEQTLPILPTTTSYDIAARFATQAAFGPRPDVVEHIQKIGMDAYISEQQSLPGITYDPKGSARTQFLRAVGGGNSLLRLRVAWALQTFLVTQGIFVENSCVPWEEKLEQDAMGNFRQLLTDIASDTSMGSFLNLAGNAAPTDPALHPNQNFARELLQLFSVGPQMLNDDGTTMLDDGGNPIPTYTQETIVDLSRALTGWVYAIPVNPDYTAFGMDYSLPLAPREELHDYGAKILFGSIQLPAGQSIQRDRDMALDAIFSHPNVPPRIARLLIQRLVKSDPSASYVRRVAQVFKDDGNGVWGNMSAVVRAILLDSEARLGDTKPSSDDGFLQEPLLFQLFAQSALQLPIADGQPTYWGRELGQNWWYSTTVFGYYNPSHAIPGTQIISPEFQLFDNLSALHRSQYLWEMISGAAPGYGHTDASWLFSHFSTVAELIEALNHLAYHGQMPDAEKQAIISYCDGVNAIDTSKRLQLAAFLALNGDAYNVSH